MKKIGESIFYHLPVGAFGLFFTWLGKDLHYQFEAPSISASEPAYLAAGLSFALSAMVSAMIIRRAGLYADLVRSLIYFAILDLALYPCGAIAIVAVIQFAVVRAHPEASGVTFIGIDGLACLQFAYSVLVQIFFLFLYRTLYVRYETT